MKPSTYEEVLTFLYQQLPMFQRQGANAFKKDLTNIRALCNAIRNPQDTFTSIHIAGTNGKGTCTHILSSVFQSAGYKVGVYTSPHYLDLRERIKIGNQLISKESLVSFIQLIKPEIEKIRPSFFELMVAMAFDYFATEKVDLAIIETGLGGRLDSTNIITPALSVITNIGYDHQDLLGETLAEIAGEKAGIIKKGIPVVIGQSQEEVLHVFTDKSHALESELFLADQQWNIKVVEQGIDTYLLNIYDQQDLTLEKVTFDLKGEVMLKNLNTALGAIAAWNKYYHPVAESALVAGLAKIRKQSYFLGRMQVVGRSPLTLADSAHNVDGLQALFQEVNKISFDKLHIVFGMVADKPLAKVLDQLPKEAKYYAVAANIPRAKAAGVLALELENAGLVVENSGSVENGKKRAIDEANSNDLVLICGSIFVVAEIDEIAVSL